MTLIIVVILVALAFEFINGFHDTANSIATVVSTKVLTPRQAIILAGVTNLTGAMIGHAVAKTISNGLVDDAFVTPATIICALSGGITWNLLTWWLGLPSSSTHALVGGLCGATLANAHNHREAIFWSVQKGGKTIGILPSVIQPMIYSPIAGLVGGFLVMTLLYALLRNARPLWVNRFFGRAQIVSAGYMGLAHGMSDAQKTMGVITLALVTATTAGSLEGLPGWLQFLKMEKTPAVEQLLVKVSDGSWDADTPTALEQEAAKMRPGSFRNAFLTLSADVRKAADGDAGSRVEAEPALKAEAASVRQVIPDIPVWIKLACALIMAAGTSTGGWRIIKTMGHKMVKLQPVHGFAAETTAATILAVTSSHGMSVSTTHCITTAIMGVGATKRFSAVDGGIVRRIVGAWILTLPAAGLVGYGTMRLWMAIAG